MTDHVICAGSKAIGYTEPDSRDWLVDSSTLAWKDWVGNRYEIARRAFRSRGGLSRKYLRPEHVSAAWVLEPSSSPKGRAATLGGRFQAKFPVLRSTANRDQTLEIKGIKEACVRQLSPIGNRQRRGRRRDDGGETHEEGPHRPRLLRGAHVPPRGRPDSAHGASHARAPHAKNSKSDPRAHLVEHRVEHHRVEHRVVATNVPRFRADFMPSFPVGCM